MNICHLTSVHSRGDTRIFLKQCRSLANAGHRVTLIVADGFGDAERDGIKIIDAGKSKGRLDRMRHAPGRVLNKALALDAEVYHLHDPELLPIGIKLKRCGKKVIFDAHEDLPKQLLAKPYLNRPARWVASRVFSVYERWACCKLDCVIAATPFICEKFKAMGVISINVNNFPLLGELAVGKIDWSKKQKKICYVGGVTRVRGILEVVKAMEAVTSETQLELVGEFSETDVKSCAQSGLGWQRINARGFLDRKKVAEILTFSVAGLVTFLPVPNHIDAQPNKMFEYMSAGVPVIASNFPLWKEIIEGNACGLCVNPEDCQAIARAVDYLVTHPQEAERMGRNGQQAVAEKYNWNIEEKKLLQLYSAL